MRPSEIPIGTMIRAYTPVRTAAFYLHSHNPLMGRLTKEANPQSGFLLSNVEFDYPEIQDVIEELESIGAVSITVHPHPTGGIS